MSNGTSRLTTVAVVGELFFPRSAELGLAVEDTVSPRVLAKMVYAGAASGSFADAKNNLGELANLSVSAERIRRACEHVAEDRIHTHERMQRVYLSKPLPEQQHGKPVEVEAPEIACVMCDGGRLQLLDRTDNTKQKGKSARKGQRWKESRIGLLVRMSGERHEVDPQPELPPEFGYNAMAETLAELGKTGAKRASPEEVAASCVVEKERVVGPTVVSRQVVATRKTWEDFGPLLASQAWYQGFAAAARKVFVSDGSSSIENLQRTNFFNYTSVLDLLHALAYSLAAARAVTDDEATARSRYDDWAGKIWKGRVEDVIDELRQWQVLLGEPPPEISSDDPREVVRMTCVYYQNHVSRMDYPSYRRQGFPLTSSLMESTVKQVSRRVKGSEKFWSPAGGEAMLRLRGEYLSDDRPIRTYWSRRACHCNGVRAYRRAKMNK